MSTCPAVIMSRPRASSLDDERLLHRIRSAAARSRSTAGAEHLPVIEGFEFTRLVAEGGMGRVFEARQLHPRRRTAVKLLRPGRDTDERRRRLFEREADALARLRHPDIAGVYCAGHTVDGSAYIAMEYVEGETLDVYASRHEANALSLLRLMARVCRAVEHAHERGVVHRDLKPSNILVDASGNPKVLDFGLARIAATDGVPDATVTLDGRVAGTLAYMSPEQLAGKRGGVDARSDVYALGVILYELLTGCHPTGVNDRSLAEIIDAVRTSAPAAPSRRRGGLPEALDRVVLRALHKDRGARYQRAIDLADDIDRCLAGLPLTRTHRGRRRLAGIAVLLLGVAGVCGSTHSDGRAGPPIAAGVPAVEVQPLPSDPDAALPVHRLAPTVTFYGDLRTIEQNLRTRLEAARRLPEGAAPDRATAVRLGLVLERLGRHAEAEPLFRESLEDEHTAPYRRVVALVRVARCVAAQGGHAEADALFAECRRLAARLGPKRDAVRAEIHVAMAQDLLSRGRATEARALLDRAGDHLDDDATNVQWARWSIASANADFFARTDDPSMEAHWRGVAADVYGSPIPVMVCER